jgi:hypothetical protein
VAGCLALLLVGTEPPPSLMSSELLDAGSLVCGTLAGSALLSLVCPEPVPRGGRVTRLLSCMLIWLEEAAADPTMTAARTHPTIQRETRMPSQPLDSHEQAIESGRNTMPLPVPALGIVRASRPAVDVCRHARIPAMSRFFLKYLPAAAAPLPPVAHRATC